MHLSVFLIIGRIDPGLDMYVTGNAVTDVIIIGFDADFHYGGEIPVFDLGIILNNLLDNAIEACEKLEPGNGFICLTLKRKNSFYCWKLRTALTGLYLCSRAEVWLRLQRNRVRCHGLSRNMGLG